MVMENLIQRRYDEEEEETLEPNPALLSVVTETREFRINSWPNRMLRRSSAIESDVPAKTPHLGKNIYNFLQQVVNNELFLGESSGESGERQDSSESHTSFDMTAVIGQPPMPQRPSIVIDSSQLPTMQREVELAKSESKDSLHMQSETMC